MLPCLFGECADPLTVWIVSPPAAMSGIDVILYSWLSFEACSLSAGVILLVLGLYYVVEWDPARRQLVKSESFLPLLPGICFIIAIGDWSRRNIALRAGDPPPINFLSILESRPASNVMLRFLKAESLLAFLRLAMLELDAQSLVSARFLTWTVLPRMLPPPSLFLSLSF